MNDVSDVRAQLRGATSRTSRAKETMGRFDLHDDPVNNLRTLLYGQNSPRGNGFAEVGAADQTNLDSPRETLLGRQDAYIEQLEKENATLKVELGNIRSTVQEIVGENQRLVQNFKMQTSASLADLPNPSYRPADPKGLSDEEKMSGGQNVPGDRKEAPATSVGVNDTDQTRILIKLRKENEDAMAVVRQLEKIVDETRTREEDAQFKVKRGIALVERAHYEKIQASVERDKIREENETLKMRIFSVEKDHEEKLEAVRKDVSKSRRDKDEADEQELTETLKKLMATRALLEKAEGEKADLQHRFQKAEQRLNAHHEDTTQMAEKMREEIAKALTERNMAAQDQAQTKVKWDRARHEHQKELLWSKLEARELRRRMEETEEKHVGARSELVATSERNRVLEKKLEWTQRWAEREIRAKNEEVSRIWKNLKANEEEWGKVLSQRGRRQEELERVIELQIRLVHRFKTECRRLEKRVEDVEEQYRNSACQLKRENDVLARKLRDAGQACGRLEKLSEEHDELRSTMKQEIDRKNLDVVQLSTRQNALMKERQLLREEMDFLWQKFNVSLK